MSEPEFSDADIDEWFGDEPPDEPQWSSIPPTEPGWYWINPEPAIKRVIYVHEDNSGVFVYHWWINRIEYDLNLLPWKWWPIRIDEPK